MSPPKPFRVTSIFMGEGLSLPMEGNENVGQSGMERLAVGGGAALHPQSHQPGPAFPNSTGLGVSTPYLQLPCRGGNEAGSVCLENGTDLRLFPLLQIPPLRGAWKTLLFIVHSTCAQRDIPQQTSYQSGGGMLSSSLAPGWPVPSPREVGNHTGAPPITLSSACVSLLLR